MCSAYKLNAMYNKRCSKLRIPRTVDHQRYENSLKYELMVLKSGQTDLK